jgi:hypothetical protein
VAFTNERHLARERCLSSGYLFAGRVWKKGKENGGNNRPTESDGCTTPESNAPSISAGSIFTWRANDSVARLDLPRDLQSSAMIIGIQDTVYSIQL